MWIDVNTIYITEIIYCVYSIHPADTESYLYVFEPEMRISCGVFNLAEVRHATNGSADRIGNRLSDRNFRNA